MREIIKKIDIDKIIKMSAIITGGLGIIYVIYYYFSHCFSSSQSIRYNIYFLILSALIVVPTVYLAQLLIRDKEYNYAKVYLILALCWGTVMQLAMPPISGVDEALHVSSVYRASNMLLGINDGNRGVTETDDNWVQGESYFWWREADSKGYVDIDLTFPKQFENIANGEWLHTDDVELTENHTSTSEWYRYVPAAIGITIGRLLHLGFYGTIFLGRFMNTLLYTLVGWFVIKILPVGKLQVILFALLPTTLNLCNSFSYDNMSILFSLLLFALILHYSKPEVKIHFWDLFIIIANVVVLMPNKIVYALFGLWIFAIPFKKWKDMFTEGKWYEHVGLGLFAVAIFVVKRTVGWKYYFIAQRYIMSKSEGMGIEQDPTRPSYTWGYIKDHLGETIQFAWDGIQKDFWYNLKHVIGCEIGMVKLNAPVNIRWTILLLVLILASYYIAGRGKKAGKQQIIVILLGAFVVLACIFIGCLIRFTPTEGSERIQISYRYIIPVYMALMMIFGNDAKENKYALGLIYAENLVLLFTMTSILTYLFTR